MLRRIRSERGHVGVTIASMLAVVGTALLAIGLGQDNHTISVAGAIVMGIGSLVGVNAPHIWLRRVYGRLDRVSPDDPDARTGFRLEL